MCLDIETVWKVTMNVFVFHILPESSLVSMFKMSVTPCDLSSSRISSLEQSIRTRQRMTPLRVFRLRRGLAVTGQPARLFILLSERL